MMHIDNNYTPHTLNSSPHLPMFLHIATTFNDISMIPLGILYYTK